MWPLCADKGLFCLGPSDHAKDDPPVQILHAQMSRCRDAEIRVERITNMMSILRPEGRQAISHGWKWPSEDTLKWPSRAGRWAI